MKTKIKICGIRSKNEIRMINTLPIDYIGFIFAPSKRRISTNQAILLKDMLKANIKTVGVFVNESIEIVNKTAHLLNLDVVQLHGEEDEDYVSKIKSSVWKAYKVDETFKVESLIKGENIVANLFDGKRPGSGEIFNWEIIKRIESNQLKILAGGLNLGNIEKAIYDVKPDIVDVSSGVEINNKKNEVLLKNLVRRIQNV